ncbi:MAG: glycosyltransferase [Hyphomicrobiales bacterium]|nr:glycosyltransferase [Hyphomicrobiales bacterium]
MGTATTGLAQLLAGEGVRVTVVYTGGVENGTFEGWRERYAKANIDLIWLEAVQTTRIAGPMIKFGWSKAWALFEYLRETHFDVMHFNDTCGEGAYCFAAKKLGVAFQDSLMCLALHSPTEWVLEANRAVPNWPGYCFFMAGEKISISTSDVLWSPSQYLLNWVISKGYAIPPQSIVNQYVIPTADLFKENAEGGQIDFSGGMDRVAPRRPSEIVFFGRLEERKGLRLFTNVLTRLNAELTQRRVSVVFMGKIQAIDGMLADQFINSRAANWTFDWRIETGFDQQQATAYLRDNRCLAVMASPVDNSPCTVYEALQFGFPFIAARSGGIPELIHPEDRDRHLFDYSAPDLARVLLDTLNNGIGAPRAALPSAARRGAWLEFHRDWQGHRPARTRPDSLRRWGVVIEHSSDRQSLENALESVRRELGADVLGTVLLQRSNSGENEPTPETMLVVDELADVSALEALAWLKERGASGLLLLRSGCALAAGAGSKIRQLGSQETALIIPAVRLLNDGTVIPPLSSPELTFLGYGSNDLGCIVSEHGFDKLLGARSQSIDSERTFLGIADFFQSIAQEMMPMPEPLFLFNDASAIQPLPANEMKQTLELAAMSRSAVYNMIGIGREYHKNYYQPPAERRRRRRRFVEKYLPFLKRKNR